MTLFSLLSGPLPKFYSSNKLDKSSSFEDFNSHLRIQSDPYRALLPLVLLLAIAKSVGQSEATQWQVKYHSAFCSLE